MPVMKVITEWLTFFLAIAFRKQEPQPRFASGNVKSRGNIDGDNYV
jgi:hypothetical protein